MIKKNFLTAAIAAAALSSSIAYAGEHGDMEKCQVIINGKNLIKEHKGDCGAKNASCAGNNKANDPEAWILVPKGECDKINHGDLSGVSDDIKDKIDMDMMKDTMQNTMNDTQGAAQNN